MIVYSVVVCVCCRSVLLVILVGGLSLVHGLSSRSFCCIKDIRAREYMTTVKVIDIKCRSIDIHDIYPTSKAIPNEKLVFKDIPFSVNDEEIIKFLNNQPGIIVKSGVIAARIRDNENKLTPFYSGDKFVYV